MFWWHCILQSNLKCFVFHLLSEFFLSSSVFSKVEIYIVKVATGTQKDFSYLVITSPTLAIFFLW